MWNVWRTVLEENEKLARARLAAVEVFHQQIADDAKVLKAHKLQTARKVEHTRTMPSVHVVKFYLPLIGSEVICHFCSMLAILGSLLYSQEEQ
jgi:hypothetical protein